jgi:hypothetical protein
MKKSSHIYRVFVVFILSLVSVSTAASAGTTTVVVKPVDDTMIKNDNPSAQSGYSMDMAVRNAFGANGQNLNEIDLLIKFDLFSIPSSAVILSASLHLYYYNWSGTDPAGRNLSLYSIENTWTEEFVNWKTQPSYAIIPSGNAFVPSSKGHWMTWDVSNDVQDLIQQRAFYGWKIADESSWKQSNIPMTYFRTKEYNDYSPFLEITYLVAEENTAPIAGFSFSPPEPTTEDSIQLADSSYDPDGSIMEWRWNFGDGNSSTLQNPTHRYTQGGHYTISLQVTDDDGLTSSMTSVLTVPIMKSTPGFEFIILLSALTIGLLFMIKRKRLR